MAAQPPSLKPQFFKILLPCFLHRPRIPEGFYKYIAGEIMPRKATILSPLGRPWIVELVHGDHNRFLYFGEGWQEFSHAHGLDVGYLVLFTYEGDMVFTVTIFDRTTCVKEYYIPVGEGNMDVDGRSSYCDVVAKPSGPQDVLHERSLTEILRSTDSHNHNPTVAATCGEGSQFEFIISSCNPCEEPSLLLHQQFVKYLSEENGVLAAILITNGKAWHIKVHEDGKGFHFLHGWQRFAEAHNLRIGDSLVFKHIGGLFFDVTVFSNHPSEGRCNNEVENAKIPKEEEISEKGAEELAISFLSGKRIAKAMEPTTSHGGSLKMAESVEHDWCEESLDVAKGSARILHFELVMNFSTTYGRYALDIPIKFAVSNGLQRIKQLFLRDPNGRLWPVRICHRRSNPHHLTGCGGWRDFCIGNNVRDGDICSFQLEGKYELHVKIHRRRHQKATKVSRGFEKLQVPHLSTKVVAEAMDPPTGQNCLVRRRSFEAHNWNSGTPNIVNGSDRISHFEAVIDFSLPHRRYMFIIPAQFIASNGLSHIRQLFLRDPHGHLWPLRISHGRHHRATAYAGWLDFCIGNNLQDGDVCLFQFKEEAELYVQICRRNQKSTKVSRDTICRKSERLLSQHSAAGLRKSERYHQVQQFTCTIPKSCYLSHHLNIPGSLLSSVNLSSTSQITLIDAEARSWPVNIYHRKSRMKSRVTIGCGWKAFCIANAVEVGDKCTFELAPGAKNSGLFHVSIMKRKAVGRPPVPGN